MTTAVKTAAAAADNITIVPLPADDVKDLWWPDDAPIAVQRVSPESSARLIALLGRLSADVKILHELDNPGRLPGPDYAVVASYFGPALHALHSGPDDLSLARPIIEYVSRYIVDDEQERAAWKRAAHEFNRRLSISEQREFLVAVRDRLQDVGANLATYHSKVRAFVAWLGRVEDWLRGGTR